MMSPKRLPPIAFLDRNVALLPASHIERYSGLVTHPIPSSPVTDGLPPARAE
jgi:hypothetical protein